MGLLDILFTYMLNFLQWWGKIVTLIIFFAAIGLILLLIACAIYGVFFL